MAWHSLQSSGQGLTKDTSRQIPESNIPVSSIGMQTAQAAITVEGQKAEEDEQR